MFHHYHYLERDYHSTISISYSFASIISPYKGSHFNDFWINQRILMFLHEEAENQKQSRQNFKLIKNGNIN